MIQRIQSIFLLLAAGAFGGEFALPFLSGVTNTNVALPASVADGALTVSDNIGMTGLAGLGALIALVAIFLYNNRPLQGKLTILGLFIGLMSLVLTGVVSWQVIEHLNGGQYAIGFGWIMPVAAIVLNWLASRGIRSDLKIINDMNSGRLR